MGIKSCLHKILYHIARLCVYLPVKHEYGFTTDKIPKLNEPYMMLSNHTTDGDLMFVGLASRRHMYFVCGDHLLRNKTYGKLLRYFVDPIPVPKGNSSIGAIRKILKRIKEGHNIMMFPEGKRSFHGETMPVSVATGALVKKAGCALVTYRLRGGYFIQPRWSQKNTRRGHVEGNVMGVYSSSELAKMSAEEITEIINRDIYENAYSTQREKMWRYVGENRAKGMEHYLFLCPKCHSYDTIETNGDGFRCTQCGMSGSYNDYGFLEGDGLPFDTVHDWGRWIEKRFDEDFSDKTDMLLFTERNVRLYRMLDGYKNEDVLTSELLIYRDKMTIGDFTFPYAELPSVYMIFGNILLFTYDGTYYGLTGKSFRAWKCGRLWHLTAGDTNDKTKEL